MGETAEDDPGDRCGIRIEVVSADNAWLLETGEEKSKAAVSIKFPGPDEDALFETEAFPPFIPPPPEPTPEELAALQAAEAAKAEAAAKAPKGKEDKGKKGGKAQEEAGPPIPGNYPMGICKEFRRKSEWPLWHTLTTEAMVVTLQWVSPSGTSKVAAGTASIDLAPLLRLNEESIEISCLLEAPKEEEAAPAGGKGKAPPPKKDAAPKGGKKGGGEVAPPLLEGAMLKLVLSTSWPLLSDIDREEAIDFEIKQFIVKPIPPKLAEFKEKSVDDPFVYNILFHFPGFTGTWWDSVTGLEEEQKKKLSVGIAGFGVVPLASSETTSHEAPGAPAETDEAPSAPAEMQDLVKWKSTFKRFLPSEASIELKKRTRRGNRCYGELARYVKDGRVDIFDPCFQNYHCGFWMDLSPLVEDGVREATLCCPLEDCRADGPRLLSQLDRVVDMKKAVAVEQVDPNAPSKNCWKESHSVLLIHVKLSRPLEPIWVPPSEPEMKLCDVIPPRPKLQPVYNASQLAIRDFNDFIKVAAKAIASLYLKLVNERKEQKTSCISRVMYSRVEHMEKMRKHLSEELHKLGAWQEMRDKMRTKVFKVACEKFKFKKEDAIAGGKFEFCNALYVQLMDEIQMGLREVFAERNILDKNLPGAVYTLESLRQLADEYEVDRNLRSADKFHLDRLVGDGNNCSTIWYEYGAFWMRNKNKDHGRAEECFREAINLHRDHLPSLQALACLFWHRQFYDQAEAVLRSTIELHPQEEFILWAILARVHAARSERASYLSSRRRAEVLYNQLIASSEHIPLLSMDSSKYPFSPAKFILRSPLSNSPFVQAALLLLDLNLPTEAHELLRLEDDVFSCTVEYKLCLAMVEELQNDIVEAERMFKEALNLEYEDPKTWCLLAHLRYSRGELEEALKAYKKVLQFTCGDHYAYAYIELGNIYLSLGEFVEARQTFLKGAAVCPCSSMWLGAGAAFYRLGELVNAEKALVEGNLLDTQNFKIWAYLCLVCISTSRMEEAEFALCQSLKNIKNAKLLAEVGVAFAFKKNFRFAEIALTESLKEEDDLHVRFHLGDVLYQQGKSNELCC